MVSFVTAGLGAAFGLTIAVVGSLPAAADDGAASIVRSSNDLFQLFGQACTTNLGHPDGVRAWASSHQLTSVTDPRAIAAYAGDGGSVWSVRLASGLFALAIRGAGQSCAVFGDKLDPGIVEKSVQQLADQMKGGGLSVAILKNDQTQTDFGRRHGVVYALANGDPAKLIIMSVITNERPGGAYQATIQIGAGGSNTGSGEQKGR